MNIYPSYKCNMHCQFCALCDIPGKPIDLDWLETQLKNHPNLCHDINILGGEPSILPYEYQDRLIAMCTKAEGEKPYYITNLLNPTPFSDKIKLIVSYDGELRPYNKRVLTNMLSLDVPFAMSTILTNNLVDNGADKYLKMLDRLPALERADLVLYRSGTTAVDNTPDHNKLMDFVAAVMDHPKVNLTPYSAMKHYTDNGFANIAGRFGFLPNNKYGVRIDYNHLGYTPFDTYEEAVRYYFLRIDHLMNKAKPCSNCKYLGHCWCVGGFEDGVCHGDREMMEFFERRLDNVHSPV